jgi:large subunit ribosomal protein L2
MIFKNLKSSTPSQRNTKLLNKSNISQKKPIKSKTFGVKVSGGRNNLGRITSFRKGGGHKKLYRKIDTYRRDLNGIVTSIQYDPNRSAYIASIYQNETNMFSYILAPKGLKSGDLIKSGYFSETKIGHSNTLKELPLGSFIHNISLNPETGGQLIKAAGNFAQLIRIDKKYVRVRLKSGEQRLFNKNCVATLGIVSNENKKLIVVGKAGRSRWLNKRPIVRGVAMNPIDHPHGGGEGKTSGGRPSVTPWGKPTRGKPTSRTQNKLIIISRKNKK